MNMNKKSNQALFETHILHGNEVANKQMLIISYEKAGYRLIDSSVVRTRQGQKYCTLTFVYDESYCHWIAHGSGLTESDFVISSQSENENLLVSNKARYHEGYCVQILKGKENAKRACIAIEDICLSLEGFWDYYFADLNSTLDQLEKYIKKNNYITFPDFGGYCCKKLVEELRNRGVECRILGFIGENYMKQCASIDPSLDVLTNSFSLQNFNQIRKREYLENKFTEAGQKREGDKDYLHVFSFIA